MKLFTKLLVLILLIGCSPVLAQPGGGWGGGSSQIKVKGKVSGTLVDSTTNKPIEFAAVVLYDAEKDKEVNGGMTNEKGKFKMDGLKPGKYTLKISFLGYEPKTIANIETTPKKPDVKFDKINLQPSQVALDAVEIEAEAPVIENKIDKIVYNAEKDATNQGGDATDVMRKVPLVSVDLEGNVQLRGSGNVRILINGKPSALFSSGNIGDALKSIPADQIKNVEVITTPSAKYEGEGTAGIINIITKKKTVEGVSGSVNTSIGTRQNNAGLNLNAAKGRFGFNAGSSLWYSWPRDGTNSFYREDYVGDLTRVLDQQGITNTSRLGFNGRAGAFYDLNAYNSFSTNIRFYGFTFDNDGDTDALFEDPINNIYQDYTRSQIANSLTSGYDWTTDYRHTFKKPEQEWSVAYQLNGRINDSNTDIIQTGNDEFLNLDEEAINKGRNRESTIQTDYVHPFGKVLKWEVGAKGVLRNINSDYTYTLFDKVDPNRSDIFNYQQNVYAGYSSFNFDFNDKYGVIAGVRYEHTDISGEFETNEALVDNDYGNVLPSVIVSRKLPNFQSIKIGYSKRIQRPSLFYINPYAQMADRRNVTVGNPNLDPELTDQVELTYNTFIKGLMLNASVYYKHTNDIISQLTSVNNDITVNTFQNVGVKNAYGMNLFASKNFKNKFDLRASFNISRFKISSQLPEIDLSNEGYEYNGFGMAGYNFNKGFKAEVFTFFRSPNRTLQGNVPSFSMLMIGAKKEIFKKKGSIGIRIVEPFFENKSFKSDLAGDNFYQETDFTIPFRSFGINFSYRFGKMDFNNRPRRSKIKNDDSKQGGDSSGGGQGGGGGGMGGGF